MPRDSIIDSHVHLKHGDAGRTEYSPEEIVETMDAADIDRSVVFAMSTTTKRSIEMASEAVRKFPDRLIPYAYALPSYERPVIDEIDRAVATLGFRGIKIHIGECTLAEYVIDPVIELAGRREVPCLIDCAGDHEVITRMSETFPETKIIVAHLGRYLCNEGALIDRFIGLAMAHRNIYLDISGVIIPSKIAEAVRRVGSERIIFGTDGPDKKPDTATHARNELEKVRRLNLEPTDQRAIFGHSIASLLRL